MEHKQTLEIQLLPSPMFSTVEQTLVELLNGRKSHKCFTISVRLYLYTTYSGMTIDQAAGWLPVTQSYTSYTSYAIHLYSLFKMLTSRHFLQISYHSLLTNICLLICWGDRINVDFVCIEHIFVQSPFLCPDILCYNEM